MLASIPASIYFALKIVVINEVNAVLRHEVESMGERSERKGNFVPDNAVDQNQIKNSLFAKFCQMKKRILKTANFTETNVTCTENLFQIIQNIIHPW